MSAERPLLLSSSTLADFTPWNEAWEDYAICQQLSSQPRETRVSALRQSLDEDLRRFIREGIIALTPNPDISDIITAAQKYLRRQRNPQLDRINFYSKKQQRGESFDAFYTSLREMFNQCDFHDMSVCSNCTGRMCSACPSALRKVNDDMLRDRIVIGVLEDATRHKLLAVSDLTLAEAIRICRAEEGATATGNDIPSSGKVNVARKSTYQRQKQPPPSKHSTKPPADSKPVHKNLLKCPKCGRTPHTKSPCPAEGRTCSGCQRTGHFRSLCRTHPHSSKTGTTVGQLKLQRATVADQPRILVNTQLVTDSDNSPLTWVADTGSDIDAIGPQHLAHLGGFPENLGPDHDEVRAANGQRLVAMGTIEATLFSGSKQHHTLLHVYNDLDDALLSCGSLVALGFLPGEWPKQVASIQLEHPTTPALPINPSKSDIDKIRSGLLAEFADVFATDSLQPMTGPAMDIQLQPDATASCIYTARPIPYAFRDQVKTQLDDMVANGIIEPVSSPSEWCHPVVIVPKKGTNEKRLTVDFKKLNDRVLRPAHPMRTAREVVAGVGSAKFFTKLDARHGYWQIPLSDQAQPLTTFITPFGCYRFLRNPQGLISAGDEFNRRTDAAFSDIERLGKVVDDCLLYDESFLDHYGQVRRTLLCAREHGITLSEKKFEFAVPEVEFCGYRLNSDGWAVDATKTTAIRDFPVPTNRTDLRSFLGLVNQCSEFSPRLSECTSPLRGLLKTSNEFVWDSNHTAAVEATKSALLQPPTLAFYQVGQDLRLDTDASALRGLGFVLWQRQGSQWRIIQCGSRYLSDAKSRYAIIELELLAIVWAVRKCSLFLSGTSFEVITDHRPLVPILNSYSLDQIENPRLQRLVLKLRSYQFHATWQKGSNNCFADALSRNPVDDPTTSDELGEDPSLSALSVRACIRQNSVTNLRHWELLEAATSDPDYQKLLNVVRYGFPSQYHDLCAAIKPFWTIREHLSVDSGLVMKGHRIVVPQSLRRSILENLHSSHQGLTRTKARARQIVYWPHLSADIEEHIRSCPRLSSHTVMDSPLRGASSLTQPTTSLTVRPLTTTCLPDHCLACRLVILSMFRTPAVKCGIPLASLLLSADTVTIMSVCQVAVSSGGTADFFALSYL